MPNEVSRLHVLSKNVTLGKFGYFWKDPSLFFLSSLVNPVTSDCWLYYNDVDSIAAPCTYQLSTEVLQNQLVSHAVAQYSHFFTLFGELFEFPLFLCLKYISFCSFTFLSQFCRQINIDKSPSWVSCIASIFWLSYQARLHCDLCFMSAKPDGSLLSHLLILQVTSGLSYVQKIWWHREIP